jgi:Flp pilus assembly pilin Flp
MFKKIIHDEHGQDLIEYGLLGSFISISAIATLRGSAGLKIVGRAAVMHAAT